MYRVIVTGAGGYIGSHMARALLQRGHYVVGMDSLVTGYRDAICATHIAIGDVADSAFVCDVLKSHRIDAVLHFAGFIQVGESVDQPCKYYLNNFSNAAALLDSMIRCDVKRFVFSSTAAIFGEPQYTPIDETHPKRPINPYGRSKLFVEELCADLEVAHGLRSVCLRYFNAAGASADATLGERHEPETHLIPLAIEAALGMRPPLKVFGNDYATVDGTCVRDYIHVEDLVDAHLCALDALAAGSPSRQFNLGNGVGFSVKQVIDMVEKVTGKSVPHSIVGRRTGDPATLVADSTSARTILGWCPQRAALQKIVEDAFRWHSKPDQSR